MELIFVHVPKCGGTTMKGILQKVYGSGMKGDKSEHENMRWRCRGSEWRKPFFYGRELEKKFPLIIGHFPMEKYIWLKDEGWKFATWVRDPVERILSIYSKRQEMGWMRHMPDIMEMNLIEVSEIINNTYNAYFDIYIDNLDFVGFTETYNESLTKLGEFLDVEIDLDYEKRNVSETKQTITEKEREIIKENLKSDYEIYEELRDICGKQRSY
jgi:hypothetical protein